MTARRFYSRERAGRRWKAAKLAAGGLLFTGFLGWMAGAEGGRPLGALIALASFPLGAAVFLWLRPAAYLEVDESERTVVAVHGDMRETMALDDYAPLSITRFEKPRSDEDQHVTYEFVVTGVVHGDIELVVAANADTARLEMEELARRWRVPCRSWLGDLRPADTIDLPLHERLRGDLAALTPDPLLPEWGVRVERLSPGYLLTPQQSAGTPPGLSLAFVVLAFQGWRSFGSEIWNAARRGNVDVWLGLAIAAFVFRLLAVRDLRRFGRRTPLRITPVGIAYGDVHKTFAEIQDVTATWPVEIACRTGALVLADRFCSPEARQPLAHELRRMIIEMGGESERVADSEARAEKV